MISGGIEVHFFDKICLILEAKFSKDSLLTRKNIPTFLLQESRGKGNYISMLKIYNKTADEFFECV